MKRESGILLHISSLPSKYGIGTFGKEAYKFVDLLEKSGQTYWQILPLGPTSFGDSPYQSFSIHALNPYFIDVDLLKEEKLLKQKDITDSTTGKYINYGKLYIERYDILYKAFLNFDVNDNDYLWFKGEHRYWLDDYAIFMSIKEKHDDNSPLLWPKKYRKRDPEAINDFIKTHKEEIEFQKFMQFLAYKQYFNLRKYANRKGIKIIGDIPIYLSYDSSDVWTKPHLFMLDEDYKPTYVAGVPPDGFSPEGQLWGNPLYNWAKHKEENFKWWIGRIKSQLHLYDYIRIDHFIGFVNYYKIKATAETAVKGVWEKAEGFLLFEQLKRELGDNLPIIAEDLGVVTDEVRRLLKETGYPGMKVLQFGFDLKGDSDAAPHNILYNYVVYTGTHDSKTTRQWINELDPKELDYVLDYINGYKSSAVYSLIKTAFKTNAKLVIIPIQDYLDLGKHSRINEPATIGHNWIWRLDENYLTKELIQKIKHVTTLYRRKRKEK